MKESKLDKRNRLLVQSKKEREEADQLAAEGNHKMAAYVREVVIEDTERQLDELLASTPLTAKIKNLGRRMLSGVKSKDDGIE